MIIIKNLEAYDQEDYQNEVSLIVERRVLAKRRWRGQAEDGTDFGFDLLSPLRNGICFHREENSNYVKLKLLTFSIGMRLHTGPGRLGIFISQLNFMMHTFWLKEIMR